MSRQPEAVGYLRTASRGRDNVQALGAQLQACERTAKAHHTKIRWVFLDFGVSGRTAERPGIYEMLHALDRDQSVGYVITADRASIAGSLSVHQWIERRIADSGCKLLYASDTHRNKRKE